MNKRRPGGVATAFVDPSKANEELGWVARRTVDDCCKDLWRWANVNPNGYLQPETKFSAFKPATFQKSSMPKFSSASRQSSGGARGLKRQDTMDEYVDAMGGGF